MKLKRIISISILIFFTITLTGCVSVKFNKDEEKTEGEKKEESGIGKIINDATEEIKKGIEEAKEGTEYDKVQINTENEYQKQQNFKFDKLEYEKDEEIKGYDFKMIVKGINEYKETYNPWAPEEGSKYMAVNIIIKNTGSSLFDYSNGNYTLTDSNGYKFKGTTATSHEHILGYNYLLPDKEINAYLVFEVDQNVSDYILKYKAKNDQTLKIKL